MQISLSGEKLLGKGEKWSSPAVSTFHQAHKYPGQGMHTPGGCRDPQEHCQLLDTLLQGLPEPEMVSASLHLTALDLGSRTHFTSGT